MGDRPKKVGDGRLSTQSGRKIPQNKKWEMGEQETIVGEGRSGTKSGRFQNQVEDGRKSHKKVGYVILILHTPPTPNPPNGVPVR